ncbi:lipoprotein [gut metagenome]|uniref:Lipoprotein n=1 Tax=gut metagenome TaxID=749906 RepID=J9BYT4_9ZZZZ
MNKLLLFFQAFILLGCFTSCIQDEPLNAECDITGVDSVWLNQHKQLFIGEPIITNDHISFSIQQGTDRSSFNPKFYLTEGARLTMTVDGKEVDANGATRNFTSPQQYTVHSQDGKWHKTYTVAFNYPAPINLLSFEHFELDPTNRYHVWFEVDANDHLNPRRNYWATGNGAYAITGMGKKPELYPTTNSTLGVEGNCVKLETCSTGFFGQSAHLPIAAGNLFIGHFNERIAMGKPREATAFGLQLVNYKPIKLTGYYKYTAGKVFTDANYKVCPDRKDTADIYAVVYEVDPQNFVALNGDDVLTSDRIVMMARIANPGEPAEWKQFEEPFRLLPGKTFSDERLHKDGYAITVVCTSSRQGAYFEGAIGSTLYVDELRIVWDEDE